MIAIFFSAFAEASQEKAKESKDKEKLIDGLKIMTMVSERDCGEDYIISTSWKLTDKGNVRHRMKYTEKRKNYRGKDGFIYKSVIRYTHPPNVQKRSFLTWNYKNREKAYWYFFHNYLNAKRTTNVEFLRPPAESDFSILDYIDVNLQEETHRFLRSEMYKDELCYVVESVPAKKSIKYGKRISWIDQDNWIPFKIEYFDKKGESWKTLSITWQKISGLWFWKKAVVENIQKKYKTFIIIEDVKVNAGLDNREFTKGALERKRF